MYTFFNPKVIAYSNIHLTYSLYSVYVISIHIMCDMVIFTLFDNLHRKSHQKMYKPTEKCIN